MLYRRCTLQVKRLSIPALALSLALIFNSGAAAEVAQEELLKQLQEQGLLSHEEARALLERLQAEAAKPVESPVALLPAMPEPPPTEQERRQLLEALHEQGLLSSDEARAVRVRQGLETAPAQPVAEQAPVEVAVARPAEKKEPAAEAEQAGDFSFPIRTYYVSGNTLFPEERVNELLAPLTGEKKKSADVEAARDLLEKFYHENGYPAVLVNIPEQTTDGGTIQLQVLEGKVGRVTVSGNRWFSTEMLRDRLPSLITGNQVSSADIKRDFTAINQNPDRKVTPGMEPGKEPGTVDFEVKVEDQLPFHGSLELNNKAGHNSTELRLISQLRYDNLWQEEHSVSLQYQMSPQDTRQVKVFNGTYMMPLPWDREQRFLLYGMWTGSESPVGDGFRSTGKGMVIGVRYLLPLTGRASYSHSLAFGVDYKDFEDILTTESADVRTPVTYLPVSLGYNGSHFDQESKALTMLNAGLNMTFRGAVTDQAEFNDKRFKGRANYLTATLGLERRQPIRSGFDLNAKLDGQLASEPLISNEEFSAGGMDSVRGYRESEAMSDSGLHWSLEAIAPDLGKLAGLSWLSARPYLFHDLAQLWVMEPLAGQDAQTLLQGVGAGMRGILTKWMEYQLDGGFALEKTNRTPEGSSRINFKVKLQW
jgi:hemolysin activation/secretion protein